MWVFREEAAKGNFEDLLDRLIPVDAQPVCLGEGDFGAPLCVRAGPGKVGECFLPVSLPVIVWVHSRIHVSFFYWY